MNRAVADLDRLYGLLDELGARLGGPRRLDTCHGRTGWPARGVYFFFEGGRPDATVAPEWYGWGRTD